MTRAFRLHPVLGYGHVNKKWVGVEKRVCGYLCSVGQQRESSLQQKLLLTASHAFSSSQQELPQSILNTFQQQKRHNHHDLLAQKPLDQQTPNNQQQDPLNQTPNNQQNPLDKPPQTNIPIITMGKSIDTIITTHTMFSQTGLIDPSTTYSNTMTFDIQYPSHGLYHSSSYPKHNVGMEVTTKTVCRGRWIYRCVSEMIRWYAWILYGKAWDTHIMTIRHIRSIDPMINMDSIHDEKKDKSDCPSQYKLMIRSRIRGIPRYISVPSSHHVITLDPSHIPGLVTYEVVMVYAFNEDGMVHHVMIVGWCDDTDWYGISDRKKLGMDINVV